MKNLLVCMLLIAALALAVLAQQPAMPSSAVATRGKNTSLKFTPVPVAGKMLAGIPATFLTDLDLEVQGLAVPKGDYSLFVLPDAKEWTLIVSKQTGTAAATYNQKMDLGRVPMDLKKAAAPAAALQMKLTALGSVAGRLELTRENTIASVPFNIDSAATSLQVIRLAVGFNSTSCSFIIRSISAAECCWVWVTQTASQTTDTKADRSCVNSTGQITC